MTSCSKIRFGLYLVALVLISSETPRIQVQASAHRFQAKSKPRSQLATKSMLNAALLETRGGWFRRRAAADKNATQAEDATNNTTPTTLGDIDSTFAAKPTPLQQAAVLRVQGKTSHDEGNFVEAAKQFRQAANLLESLMSQDEADNSGGESLQDACSTCRFHESLCCLKAEDYEGCVEACSSLLDSDDAPAAMIRARAFHRRAKAKVALDDIDGALVDARSAAFLGDRKASLYYGKLLRETGGKAPDESLLPTTDTSALFESLLGKSPLQVTDCDASSGSDFLTSSLLGSLGGLPSPGGLAGAGNNGGGGSLAKSVLSSLSKKLEDESTHDGICNMLQSTNPVQVQSMASMAGIELSSSTASRLVDFAHGITPKTIRRTVKLTKRGLWGFQLTRKTMALLSKYRNIFFLVFLLQWTKSALFRPIPLPKVKAPKVKGGRAQPAPKAVQKTNPGAPAPGAGQQQGGKKPLTPGLIGGAGGGLAALAADR